jgi:hypothetical protein
MENVVDKASYCKDKAGVVEYRNKHPLSRKSILRATWSMFRTQQAVEYANSLMRSPVHSATMQRWCRAWETLNVE